MRSSISCAETKFEATSVLRRFSVASDSLRAGLLADEVGAGLQQLLIEIRRLDLGDHLAGLDLCRYRRSSSSDSPTTRAKIGARE